MGPLKADWLAQLAPPHAPPPPGWWPLAPGWWGLALVLAIAVAAIVYWQTRRPARLRRVALRELQKLEATPGDDRALAQSLQRLLRRVAVARFGRDAVAGLSGDRWIAFVVDHGGREWSGAAGSHLLRAAFGGPVEGDRRLWLGGARGFLKEGR